MKIAIGFLVAFTVGALCRWFDIPLPAPPRLLGALLILTVTFGYLAVDRYLAGRGAPPPAESAWLPSSRTDGPPPAEGPGSRG